MGKFTRSFTRTFTFNGKPIMVTMERMKRKDAMRLMPYMGEPDESGKVKLSFQNQMEMLDVAADLLPKYVKAFEYEDATLEEVLDEAFFIGLVGEIVSAWTEASFAFGDDEKKSDATPASDSREPATQAVSESVG